MTKNKLYLQFKLMCFIPYPLCLFIILFPKCDLISGASLLHFCMNMFIFALNTELSLCFRT